MKSTAYILVRNLCSFGAVALAVVSLSTAAHADQTARTAQIEQMRDIFNIVKKQDGFLTKQMHARFWTALEGVTGNNDIELRNFWSTLSATPDLVSKRFIYEAVETMRLSAREKRIQLSPNYLEAKRQYLASSNDVARLSKIRKAVDTWERNHLTVGNSQYNPSGAEQRELARKLESELSKVHAVMRRFSRLKAPDWIDRPFANRFNSLPFTISWPSQFIFEHRSAKAANKGAVTGGVLRAREDKDSSALVMYLDGGRTDFGSAEKFVRRLARNTLAKFGVQKFNIASEDWRGLNSAVGRGSGMYRGTPMQTRVRTAALPNANGYIILVTLARQAQPDDGKLFADLQLALQFQSQ